MVIIAVPSNKDGGLNELMNSRFGRSPSFTFVTIEEKKIIMVKAIQNPGSAGIGKAGIESAKLLKENKASVLIVDLLGPNAANTISSMGINVYHASSQNNEQRLYIKEIISQYLEDKLEVLEGPNVEGHHEN